jgi:hypothetical protein
MISEEARAAVEVAYRAQVDAGYTDLAAADYVRTTYAWAIADAVLFGHEPSDHLIDRYRAARELSEAKLRAIFPTEAVV